MGAKMTGGGKFSMGMSSLRSMMSSVVSWMYQSGVLGEWFCSSRSRWAAVSRRMLMKLGRVGTREAGDAKAVGDGERRRAKLDEVGEGKSQVLWQGLLRTSLIAVEAAVTLCW